MGFGLDLDGVDDSILRQTIARASSVVDAYCAVPMLPVKHDFRGGSIASEQHDWHLGDPTQITSNSLGSRRVYPNHKPIRAVTDFRVKFTQAYEVLIEPANLYVNRIENWAEVVSIAAVVSGIYPVGVNFGLYTPVAEVSYAYGHQFPVTGETLEPTDAGTYRSTNCWWDSTVTPKVYLNGAVQNSGYTVDYDEGTVAFTNMLMASDVVTADYTHRMPSAIADATAMVVTKVLGERAMDQRGMTGIQSLHVAEVEFSRVQTRRGAVTSVDQDIAFLLDPYRYVTVR